MSRFTHRYEWISLFVALAATSNLLADVPRSPDAAVKVAPKPQIRAYAFDMPDVQLLDGPFLHARDLDAAYVLSLDVDRLLHCFRINAGLPSSAKPLGGWEEPKCEVRGHFVGHYLSACALLYASTGDERFKKRAEQLVAGMAECQAKVGSGYLSAYPEEFIDRVETQRQVWAPYYTLHKILAGLLDVYVHCGSQMALDVCEKFGDWVVERNGKLTDEQMQKMLGNEHGGMNEVLANLYGVTGEAKYLEAARRFNHMAVIGPATQRQDKLTGLHANTQIPKFVGTAREYELTGDEAMRTASEFFWNTVAKERSYVIGGHSDGEMFTPKERLSEAFGPSTTETCNTYNMLKLTRHLYEWTADPGYADYYERALLNHILCSQNPKDGMMCYYVPLRSGSHKVYNDQTDSFWCCTGTGVENHAKYNDSIYFHDGGNEQLFVNLFIASEVNWKAKGVRVRQETRFPETAESELILKTEKPVKFRLAVRRPAWAVKGFAVAINGTQQLTETIPGQYVVLEREWADGDRVSLSMPFSLRTEGFKDNPKRFAFLDGPVVLSAEVKPGKVFPAIVSETEDVTAALKPVSGKASTFTVPGSLLRVPGQSNVADLVLEPFYKMHEGRSYMVYWDRYTVPEWKVKEDQFAAKKKAEEEMAARTLDRVEIGNDDNEKQHKLSGEKTGAGPYGDRFWRHASDGGWFSYQLRVQPDKAQKLEVTYWGSDVGPRTFDILVEGTKIGTQTLNNNHPNEFFDVAYEIPAELTKGKDVVTVRFQAQPGNMAGGVFGCRILK